MWAQGQKGTACIGKLIKQTPRNEWVKETGKLLKGFLFSSLIELSHGPAAFHVVLEMA